MKEKPTKAKKKGRTIRAFKRDISLWLFCVPGVILTFIFSYIPMYGVQIAFRRFNATAGITKSPWVGMYYFERFFNSPYFASTIKNTLILSLYGLVVSFPIGMERFKVHFPNYELPDTAGLMQELGLMIAQLNLNDTVFRSDHASNYLALKGTLGRDKERLLAQIHQAVAHPERANLRAEWMRGL